MLSDTALESGSPDRFGYAWDIYSDILPIHERQFDGWTSVLPDGAWKDATFLDVGCGMGRNGFWAIKKGARRGRAIDVDNRSLNAAKRNLQDVDVSVEFESVYDLAEENEYDIAFSIGVVHHLSNPDLAVANMKKAVKPGGTVLVWLYGYENNEWIVRWFDPFRRTLFSKLPLSFVYFLSLFPTAMLWLLLRTGFGLLEYHKLLRDISFGHLRSIVFDQMIPQIAKYYRHSEVLDLLARAGLEDIRIVAVNDMSWSAMARKPLGTR